MLLRKLRRGDDAAWRKVRAVCEPTMARMASRILATGGGSQDDLDDILSASWMKAWRAIKTVREARYLQTWLVSIVKHETLTRLRRVRRERRRRVEWDAADAFNLGTLTQDPLIRRDLLRALGRMRGMYSLPIVLSYFEGWTYNEIAARLLVSEGTVKTRVHRGMCMLRDEFLFGALREDALLKPKVPDSRQMMV